MKKIALVIATVGLVSCGQSNDSASLKIETNAPSQPFFTCTISKPEQDLYYAKIALSETKLTINQSSRSARFAPIVHTIEKNDTLGIPDVSAAFTCTVSKPEQDGYHATISVYEDRVILLQSSRNARFAPLKYKIIAPATVGSPVTNSVNEAAARRSYYVCGAYNVTVEAIEGALNDRMTINSANGFEVLKEIKDDGESDIFQSAETGTNVWISGLRRYPLRQIIYGVTLTEFGGSEGGIVANCAVDPAHG